MRYKITRTTQQYMNCGNVDKVTTCQPNIFATNDITEARKFAYIERADIYDSERGCFVK